MNKSSLYKSNTQAGSKAVTPGKFKMHTPTKLVERSSIPSEKHNIIDTIEIDNDALVIQIVDDDRSIELESLHDYNAEEILDVSNGSVHSQIKDLREQSKSIFVSS